MTMKPVNPWAALSALCLGFFMVMLDTTIVPIAMPSMLRELPTGLNAIVWVVSVYLLTYAVLMLFGSRLGDRFGPRRVCLAGLAVFTVASVWCGLSGDVGTLIVARALQGVGAALLAPQILAFVGHLFPPAERGPAMGIWAATAGLGTVAGPLLGGVLSEHLGWEWIFLVNVPLGCAALVLTWLLVPDWRPRNVRSFDVAGLLLSGAGLLLIVFGVQNGHHYDWGTVFGPVTVFEIIGLGVALLAGFVFWQRGNRREPLMPLSVFRNRNFSSGTLTWAIFGFALTGMIVPLVLYLQAVLGLTATMAGLLTAPMSLLAGLLGPLVGRASDKVNGKYLVMFGLAALTGGLGAVALQAGPATDPWTLLPAFLVCGLGYGFILAPITNLAMGAVEPHLLGTASGIFNTARQIGGVFGSAAVGVLLQTRITTSITDNANSAAASLPEQYRAPFVADVVKSAASAGQLVNNETRGSGLPADIATRASELATHVVHNGLADASRQALLLPMGILLLGILATATMRPVQPLVNKPD
ncbi:MFS transporter [Amycolatopsis japonica]|uniref:MFS transporter n=1 Tax=Amycolatopsis japonica TaxID=208439 RepID=UPI00366BB577